MGTNSGTLQLILNAAVVDLPDVDANLLDWLRASGLTAAKPGCRGGDCGACQVLLGEVPPGDTEPAYRTVNSCLLTTLMVADCHVVTVEGLDRDPISPVQQALVDHGAIQCGYCTPGLVTALTGALLSGEDPAIAASGNLCRCTGYAGIRRACDRLASDFSSEPRSLAAAAHLGLVSEAVADAGAALRPLRPDDDGSPPADRVLLGGETDFSVQHPHASEHRGVLRVHRIPALRGIAGAVDTIHIGAAVTVAELRADPMVAQAWPQLVPALERFGSPAIRHVATVGGNLVNASPVGDLGVILLALDAGLILDGPNGPRTIPLDQFFRGYKDVDLSPGEILTSIVISRNTQRAVLHAEKVSRRRHDDIASVCSAMVVTGGEPGRFGRVRVSAGGVAPVPLLLRGVAGALSGNPISVPVLRDALAVLRSEIAPIDDVRGSASYKARLLGHLIVAHAVSLNPDLDVWGCLS